MDAYMSNKSTEKKLFHTRLGKYISTKIEEGKKMIQQKKYFKEKQENLFKLFVNDYTRKADFGWAKINVLSVKKDELKKILLEKASTISSEHMWKIFWNYLIQKKTFPSDMKSWFPKKTSSYPVVLSSIKWKEPLSFEAYTALLYKTSRIFLSLMKEFSEKKAYEKIMMGNQSYHTQLQQEDFSLENYVASDVNTEDYILRSLMKFVDYKEIHILLWQNVVSSFQSLQRDFDLQHLITYYFFYQQFKKISNKLPALLRDIPRGYLENWSKKSDAWRQKLQLLAPFDFTHYQLSEFQLQSNITLLVPKKDKVKNELKMPVNDLISILDTLKIFN